MRETVVIKGNKSGMTVILDDQVPFDELLLHVAKKFRESARFWGSVQMTLSLEGRPLSAREELMIVDQISENSGIEILCLLDRDLSRIERCEKALNERLMVLSSRTGQFYKGNLKRGETLESEASIVIIGDVGHGAKVMARGNIIVLGLLNGTACAGAAGDSSCVITALEMAPMQLRIAGYASALKEKGKRLGRGPMIACVEQEKVSVKTLKKNLFSAF